MTDPTNNIASELREAERVESLLTRLFASIQPPIGALERLLAKLRDASFHESELTLDDSGPYSFEQAAQFERFESDLLAAGLDEEEIDEDDEE